MYYGSGTEERLNSSVYSKPITSHALGELAGSSVRRPPASFYRWAISLLFVRRFMRKMTSCHPLWKYGVTSKVRHRQLMRIYLKNNQAEF